MIGKLRGIVDLVGEAHCIVDVSGVGYEVATTVRALNSMSVGDQISLIIDTHVREDAIKLYGFTSEKERDCFRILLRVQGVGAKASLGVLSILAPDGLIETILAGDWFTISKTPGIGKKISQRIVTELKDKVLPLAEVGAVGSTKHDTPINTPVSGCSSVTEATSALCNLGYQPAQASEAVTLAAKEIGDNPQTAELIRRGLKILSHLV